MSDQNWKAKYLKELEQHERDEKNWRAQRHDLQRLLVRACLAAEGQDGKLDELLVQLRELARSDDPDLVELRRLQGRLEKVVAGFDEARETAVRELRQVLDRLVEPLLERAAGEVRRELKGFSRQSGSRLERFASIPAVLGELASLQRRILEEIDAPAAVSRRPWWQRLFGRAGDTGEVAVPGQKEPVQGSLEPTSGDLPEPPALSEQAEGLELDAGKENTQGQEWEEDDIRVVGERLARLLYQLKSQLTLPTHAGERAESLLEQARATRHWEQMQEIVDEVAHLIVAAVGKGQRDFEAFLSGLDERLVRIQSQFQSGALDLGGWWEVTEHYDRALHREIDDMESHAEGAAELSEFKSAVQSHVERLNSTLDEYREAGAEREERLREEVRSLQEKVNAMEAESQEVHKELQEERRRATTDMLTQLPNREAMEERIQEEYKRWERYRESTSLAMIDVDYFKHINDTYGHLAGDKVLQLLARALRENLREPDYIARYGGEEFIVVLPATDAETACDVLDKLRERIQGLPFHFRSERVVVTFSGGVVGFTEVGDPYRLLDRADRALYRAKEQGRNRVLLAEERDFETGATQSP